MLCDYLIQQAIVDHELDIDPFDERLLQPASLDLTLDGEFLTLRPEHVSHIDPALEQPALYERIQSADHFYVHPGQFIIASSQEVIRLGNSLVGRLEGKSSLGRLGLLVHSTAGFFDPGFHGQATLEIANVSGTAIKLYVGMPICQFAIDRLHGRPKHGYQGKYQNQRGPQPSRYYLNFGPGGYMQGRDH